MPTWKRWWGRLKYARCFTHTVPGVPETFWPFSTLPSGGRPKLFAVARHLPCASANPRSNPGCHRRSVFWRQTGTMSESGE
jgi:hypothetical protein